MDVFAINELQVLSQYKWNANERREIFLFILEAAGRVGGS